MYGIEELIALAAEKRASDVHLIAGLPPKCRIDGRIETLTDGGLTREDCEEYGRQLAGNAADQIEAIGQLDFSASFAGRRLRVNLFRSRARSLRRSVFWAVRFRTCRSWGFRKQ